MHSNLDSVLKGNAVDHTSGQRRRSMSIAGQRDADARRIQPRRTIF
jgi:hypothetical protein